MARSAPLILLAMLLAGTNAYSQVPGELPPAMAAMAAHISGTVADGVAEEPLEFATVAVFMNGDFVTGAATDAEGRFHVGPLRPGTFVVRVSSVGFETAEISDVSVRPGETADIGQVRLDRGTLMLDEAQVVAERELVEHRADRTIYNVADQPVATGGSVIEVLQTLPSLEVDLDGNIALRGNQNIAIHINGRSVPIRGDQLTAFLRQLPADQVQRVEVLPNPSARYEADSMGGIVNIVLKEGVSRGLSGGFTVGGGTAPSGNVSGNIAYQQGPIDAFASYGLRYDDWSMSGASFRFTPANDSLPYLDQTVGTGRENFSHVLNTQLDYTLREGLTLNTRAMVSARTGATENFTLYEFLNPDRQFVHGYERTSDGTAGGFNANASIGLKQAWEPQRHELTFDARYNVNRNTSEDLFIQPIHSTGGFLQQLDEQRSNTGEATLRLDYQRPVADGRIEVGARAGLRRIDNERIGLTNGAPEPGRTNQFAYDQDVYAAYLQGAQKLGPVELQAGLRAEHTALAFHLTTTDEGFDRSYTDFFPSAFVSFTPWMGGTLRGGYSRRINRPWPQQLSPFPTFDDPLNVRRGNPDLRPEYTDSFEITASQFLPFGTVSLTPFYRRTTDVIRPRFLFDEETGVSTFTMENLDVDDSYGADLTLAGRLGQHFQGFVSGSVYRTVTSAGSIETGLGTDALAYSLRGSVNARLRDGLNAQIFTFWRSPMESIDGRMSGFTMMSLGLRQQLLGDRATLSLRVNDPLNLARFEFTSTRAGFSQEGFRDPSMRRMDLSFTYTFGQVTQQQRRQRAQEEMPDIPQDQFGF